MILTIQQRGDSDAYTHCPRCNIKFDEAAHNKVHDHDHMTVTTSLSNFVASSATKATQVKNFKNYDAYHLIKYVIDKFEHWKLSIIA